MNDRQKTITTHSSTDTPTNLLAFREWVDALIAEVPPEYRAEAEIRLAAHVEYDVEYVQVLVSYERPYTEAELAEEAERDEKRRREEMGYLRTRLLKLEGRI